MAEAELDTPAIIAKTFFVSLFMILSITGNISVIHVVKKHKKLQSVTNYFVCSLATSDILYTIFGGSSMIATTVEKRWVFGSFYCHFIGTLNTLVLTASLWTLVAIAVNRYLAIKKPFEINKIYTTKRTIIIIVSIWLGAFAISIPPVFGWSKFTVENNFCIVNSKKHFSYTMLLFFTNFIVPSISLVTLYACIYKLIKKQNLKMKNVQGGIDKEVSSTNLETKNTELTVGGLTPTTLRKYLEHKLEKKSDVTLNNFQKLQSVRVSDISLDNTTYLQVPNITNRTPSTISAPPTPNTLRKIETNKLFTKERRTTTMLLAILVTFFVCYLPFTIASLLFAFGLAPTNFGLVTFGLVITFVNGILNPIIYGVMNSNFRAAYKDMYSCCFPCSKKKINNN